MNIIVFGAGAFGTAIAKALSMNKENNVQLFSKNESKVNEINTLNTNKSCFPGKHLPSSICATSNENVFSDADIVFIAYPSSLIIKKIESVFHKFKENVLIVNLSKGLLNGGVTVVDAVKQNFEFENIVTLKGPSFAVELMDHASTLLTLGYKTQNQFDIVNKVIKKTVLHIDFTNDIRGVEILSSLKNIYAIFLGIVDAKYNSSNTRFMMLTKAFSEVRLILKELGGCESTLFLSCGFGDLCLTSLNDLSRNRTLGLLIGKEFYNEDYKSNSVILEGLNSIKMIYNLVNNNIICKLPILAKLHDYFSGKTKEIDVTFNDFSNITIK